MAENLGAKDLVGQEFQITDLSLGNLVGVRRGTCISSYPCMTLIAANPSLRQWRSLRYWPSFRRELASTTRASPTPPSRARRAPCWCVLQMPFPRGTRWSWSTEKAAGVEGTWLLESSDIIRFSPGNNETDEIMIWSDLDCDWRFCSWCWDASQVTISYLPQQLLEEVLPANSHWSRKRKS